MKALISLFALCMTSAVCFSQKMEGFELAQFKIEFNKNSDKNRIITIGNPACGACVQGQKFISSVLSDSLQSGESVIEFLVWTPIKYADKKDWGTKKDAKKAFDIFENEQIRQFWDGEMLFGPMFKRCLGLNEDYPLAWDVYMIYPSGIEWTDEEPPIPGFWFHQIGGENTGAPKELFHDKEGFLKYLKELTNTTLN